MRWFETGELHFALGIEDTFIPQNGPGRRTLDEYALTQHYDNWESDLELVAMAGARQLRWGVPWYRVNPEYGVWRWDWLDRVVAKLSELEIEPLVDLMHYGTPLWLDGQFANADYPQLVTEYSVAVAERYRDQLSIFTPVNEPWLNARFCGAAGYWPPYLEGARGFVTMTRALSQGIVQAQCAIASALPDATFLHVEATSRYIGDPNGHDQELATRRELAFVIEDLVTGRVDGAHPLLSFLQSNGLSDDDLAWFSDNAVIPDVMGVNYYPQHSTRRFQPGAPLVDQPFDPRQPNVNGWTDGLVDVLQTYAVRYGRPVYLTETAWTGTLLERQRWLDASVDTIHRLRAEGTPVIGYTWWPVFDMVEWTYREGGGSPMDYRLPMGLWRLEEQLDGSLARVETPLARAFREHAAGEQRSD